MLQRSRGAPLRYHLFILTVWEEESQPEGPAVWRYSLEQSRTGERKGFTEVAELLAYLITWTQQPPAVPMLAQPEVESITDVTQPITSPLAPLHAG